MNVAHHCLEYPFVQVAPRSGDIIRWCVRWYLRYPFLFTDMAEMAVERGLSIDASCIWRWVQVFGPELYKRCRPHLKPTNRSWRLDETYINIRERSLPVPSCGSAADADFDSASS